jgi:hypothetical protein
MPLTDKGDEILAAMKKQYGDEKGEQVFYASKNSGKISGVDATEADCDDAKRRFDDLLDKAHDVARRVSDAEKGEIEPEPEVKSDDAIEDMVRETVRNVSRR